MRSGSTTASPPGNLKRSLSPPLIDPTRPAANHSPLSGTGRSAGSAQARPLRPAVSADASSRENPPRPRSAATSRTGPRPPDLIRFPTGAPGSFSSADDAGLKGNSQSHRSFMLRSKFWPKMGRPCTRAYGNITAARAALFRQHFPAPGLDRVGRGIQRRMDDA